VKYGVQGVPKIIINEEHSIEGLPPDMDFVKKMLKAIGQ
jgi:protein-disulfide isomerase